MTRKRFMGLNGFELGLWLFSLAAVTEGFVLFPGGDLWTLVASLVGATALIFVAKGRVLGQALTVLFAVLYGVISYDFRYYGEMLTYLGMTAPIAVLSLIEWKKHPYEGAREVKTRDLTRRQAALLAALSVAITGVFYFILRALGNENLAISTVSVTTSFVASALTAYRSPYYALGYAANDVVLIILWVLAAMVDASYISMVICFTLFFINDLYGFFAWRAMRRRQLSGSSSQSARSA